MTVTQQDHIAITAGLQLRAAVDELTEPGTVDVDRDIPLPGTTAYQLAADDRALEAELRERIRDAAARNDWGTWETTLVDLAQLYRRRAARTSTTAPVPSLLEQLAAAVESSGGGSGGPAAAASRRSPIGLEAADLLARIQRATAAPASTPDVLTDHVRAWASSKTDDEDRLTTAADVAQTWVTQANELLTPHRRMELVSPCPACGERHARASKDGETVVTAALQFDLTAKTVRCLRCTETWDEHQLDFLRQVLDQQNTEEPRR